MTMLKYDVCTIIANHNMLQNPNYVDIVDLLGEEEPYGPYNEIGIQKGLMHT